MSDFPIRLDMMPYRISQEQSGGRRRCQTLILPYDYTANCLSR